MDSHRIDTFADVVLHELRTPLSVVVGELDLALARERPASAYRETLQRISESVAELVDLTADLSSIVASTEPACEPPQVARLDAVLAAVAERYGGRRGLPVAFPADRDPVLVIGAADVLAGALSLLIEHALKHRPRGSRVRLGCEAADGRGGVELTIDVEPAAMAADVWHRAAGPVDERVTLRRMRVDAAASLLRRCGGSLVALCGARAGGLLIRLRPIADGGAE
jgi:signal transduction histidine kinase